MTDLEDDFSKRIEAIGARIDTALHDDPKEATPAKRHLDLDLIFCKHLPTSDQTNGIAPFYVRLCATIADDVYAHKSNISEFGNLATGYNPAEHGLKEPPKAVLYDNHGIFEPTNAPFVAVVAGTKLMLAWRGSVTLMDWIRDFSFYVASSYSVAVKVHGGFLTMIESTMSVHEDKLLEIVKEYGIQEILVTGHSLGGK